MSVNLNTVNKFEIRDFFQGYLDAIDDNLLPENATRDCKNFVSRAVGEMEVRPGQKRLNTTSLGGPIKGLHTFYDINNNRKLIAAANGSVGVIDLTTGVFTAIKTGLDASANVHFETCVNYMVSFNGVDAPWKYDGTTVTALANTPVDGKFCVLHKEKLFTVPASDPSLLKWSNSFQPEVYEAVNYWPVLKGDGDVITNLMSHFGQLVIFKRYSINVLSGTSMDDFSLDTTDNDTGAVGERAAVGVGPYIYYISDEGLCVWNTVRSTNISENVVPGFWRRVNQTYLHNAAVGFWDGIVWFALPIDGSTTNNAVMAFIPDPSSAAQGTFWPLTNINATMFRKFNDGEELRFFSGDTLAGYLNEQWTGNDDFGAAIDAYWIGKTVDLGAPETEKVGYPFTAPRTYIERSPDTTSEVSVEMSLDGGAYTALTSMGTDGIVHEYKFAPNVKWRNMSPKLIHSGTTPCKVRGLMVPYKVKRSTFIVNS